MPKMKKTRSKTKSRSAPRVRRGKRAADPTRLERLRAFARRYALAAVAGGAVILAGAGAVFWAGGYVGLVAERVDKAVGAASVAAGFEIRRVTLKGRRQAALDEINSAIGPVIGRSLLHLDLDAARGRIEELGWVRAASVSRLLPDTVHVSVIERTPAAVWQISGGLFLVDVSGGVIREIGAYEYSSLPLIVGAGAPGAASDLLLALSHYASIREMTSALIRVGERRWNLRLRDGLDIKLPEKELDEALEVLATLHEAHGILDQELEYIDLRDPERMVVRNRNDASDPDAP
jgi:cell division protein FtsQ